VKEIIPEITIKIGDKEYKTNYQEEIKISRETLDDDMIVQSALYAWYAVLAAMLDEEVGIKKLKHEVSEAQLYDEYRRKLQDEGVRVTEKAVESAVKQDERYISSSLELAEAKKNKKVFDAIVEAFEHRKEMLINLGAKFRREMDGDVVVKKTEHKE